MINELRKGGLAGPAARVQSELHRLDTRNRDLWVLIIFAAAVLALGALALLVPSSFWHQNTLEMKIPPQVIFVVMMVFLVVALFMLRREMEVQKLRLINLQQTLAAQTEYSASMMDALTNVFNRRFLRELLQTEISRAERNNRPVVLLMCDLDNFKVVNDRYGHLMGDHVLLQVANILKACVRGSDTIIRYGGDEFLLLLPETDEAGAEIVRRRIYESVEAWNRENRIGDIPISISVGLYTHVHGQSVEQDLAEADARMYATKQASQPRAARASAARR
ncbi:MAG TPA: GGDEF domain-containing protein [Terriglobia bacterium]|nr:GGDEF domain-containing protein [Terriglobia bacterium]